MRLSFDFSVVVLGNALSGLSDDQQRKGRIWLPGDGEGFIANRAGRAAFQPMMAPEARPAKAAFVMANP